MRWLVILAVSSVSPTPQTSAIQAPSTPSERQPAPYWYLGPSASSSARASAEP